MTYKIRLSNGYDSKDYVTGLTEQEAILICEEHQWTDEDEFGTLWTMDIVEDD